MPIIAAVKVAALALVLTCAGSARTAHEAARLQPMPDANPPRLQCRMYFGCIPIASLNTAVARQQEYVR